MNLNMGLYIDHILAHNYPFSYWTADQFQGINWDELPLLLLDER